MNQQIQASTKQNTLLESALQGFVQAQALQEQCSALQLIHRSSLSIDPFISHIQVSWTGSEAPNKHMKEFLGLKHYQSNLDHVFSTALQPSQGITDWIEARWKLIYVAWIIFTCF